MVEPTWKPRKIILSAAMVRLLKKLARPGRLERPTCGFVVDFFSEAISHHFQTLKYQALTKPMLE
jgi:hypothetical protein